METHNTIRPSSESEEMYLLTATRLLESGIPEPIPLTALAQALEIQTVSANQMVHTLEAAGLLVYTPYKGIQLTESGRQHAERILRFRKLWKFFLEEHLGLPEAEADALACEFEHVTTEEAAQRLEHYLAVPTGGDRTEKVQSRAVSLAQVIPGQTVGYHGASPDLAPYLATHGLKPGDPLRVVGRGPGGDVLVEIPAGMLHLAAEPAEKIFGSPWGEPE